jgi:hypothetical protein
MPGMGLSDKDKEFLKDHHSAAMITVGADGFAKAARVGVILMDGKLWSSSTQDRIRTARLRRDPRSTLFVFDSGFAYLTLETTVTILEGPDVASQNLRMFRDMQQRPTGPLSWFGEELSEDLFLQRMIDEQRVIYEFEAHRSYGLY